MTQTSERVALIKDSDEGLMAVGAFSAFRQPFSAEAEAGDLILVDAEGRPTRRFGRPSSVQAVLEAMLADAREPFFTDEELTAAEAVSAIDSPRRDLRDLPTFTIDGESTCDFDDALSARVERRGIRVWIHVADVTAYVRPGDVLDRAAFERCASIYLPTTTRPMLPPALSNDLCSLVPGEDRLAVTVEMLVRSGRCIERSFYRSTIRSDARLTYDTVDQVFLGRMEPGPTYSAALRAARAASTRGKDNATDNHEPSFRIEAGEVVDVYFRPHGESHRLIELLMVMANEQVADFLAERRTPSLYRVHQGITVERREATVVRLKACGLPASLVDEGRESEDETTRRIIQMAYETAAYSPDVAPHAGLESEAYTHFTSPIRRYADIIVHRALLAEIEADELTVAPRLSELTAVAGRVNERARAAKRLERRANDVCHVSHLLSRLAAGEPRERTGIVWGMSDAGLFVDVGETEGFLPLTGSPDRYRAHFTDEHGRAWRMGDRVDVIIHTLDPVRGRVRLIEQNAPKVKTAAQPKTASRPRRGTKVRSTAEGAAWSKPENQSKAADQPTTPRAVKQTGRQRSARGRQRPRGPAGQRAEV